MPAPQRLLQVQALTVQEMNRVLEEISEELALLRGLRGRLTVHDDVDINGNLTVRGELIQGQQ